MILETIDKQTFRLNGDDNVVRASIMYTTTAFNDAELDATEKYILSGIGTGSWIIHSLSGRSAKVNSKIKVEIGGIMSITMQFPRRKYIMKKSAGWKLRFSLGTKEGEDFLTLIPTVNWEKESYDYVIQLNEEFEAECDSFLILQAVHCANCSLSMMTGGRVPALVSI
jgi:hypothetical protein